MTILFDSLSLLLLFVTLGWFANLAVQNIKYLGAILKIRLAFFGILLGFITTLPELFLGINATIDRAASLSVGNLLGGVIVMLGLILGASLLLNRGIKTDGNLSSLIPTVLVIFSPVLFGIDGKYGLSDGLIMIGLYLGLIFFIYHLNHFNNHDRIEITNKNKVAKSIIFSITGIVGILITSHLIIGITLSVLNYIQINRLIIGLVIFSIGTNLPEISVAITSWRKKSSELSLSHLLSSSFTNVLVLGVLALLRPIIFDANSAYWVVTLFLGTILASFAYFYYSEKKMDRCEGFILFAIYILFIAVNFYLII